ncbi:unnamed protein product [Protopolystoma xenopodis]|uniref:Uncharacterized protein n=1 Tax=Protopolystoma xenopodis TaxID=117903 RepID=A0A3S5FDK1_9PLAT|nr:unnamed protein product [Protopolystoma xenopodis]
MAITSVPSDIGFIHPFIHLSVQPACKASRLMPHSRLSTRPILGTSRLPPFVYGCLQNRQPSLLYTIFLVFLSLRSPPNPLCLYPLQATFIGPTADTLGLVPSIFTVSRRLW